MKSTAAFIGPVVDDRYDGIPVVDDVTNINFIEATRLGFDGDGSIAVRAFRMEDGEHVGFVVFCRTHDEYGEPVEYVGQFFQRWTTGGCELYPLQRVP